MARQRRETTQQVATQIKAALGETRAAEFERASNYEFQQLAQVAQRENLPLTAANQAYDLRNTTSLESLRISNDPTLTNEQKLAAMKTLAQTTRAQLITTLGPTAGASYGKSATWLQAIEGGTVVTFEGTTTFFRPVSTPSPNAPRN